MTQQADHNESNKGPNQDASLPFGGSVELLLATLETDDGFRAALTLGPDASAAQISRTVDQITGRRGREK